MILFVLALVLSACAVWLAVPGRHRRLGRHRRPPPSWAAAREGSLPGWTRSMLGGGAAIAVALVLESTGTIPALLAAVTVGTGVAIGLGRLEPGSVQRVREQRYRDLPQALDLLAGALASGLPLRRATREVAAVMTGPVGDDLALVVGLVDVGLGERRAWQSLADRPGWTAARDIGRAAESGTGLRTTLIRHADHARRAAQARRIEHARTLGVRSVLPLMVCFLPAFVLVGIVPTVGSMIVGVLRGS